MTYNHSLYIKDALDGFCMQLTNFPFVCGIIDDASTDGTPNLIQQYLKVHFDLDDTSLVKRDETKDYDLIFARHKENKNCFFVVINLKYNHYQIKKTKDFYMAEWEDTAVYIALCEGDDYWIDPMKLQKQVDFMDSHPEHSLCFCAHKCQHPTGEFSIEQRYEKNLEQCPIDDIILGGGSYMATNSMLYRQSLYVPYQTWAIGCPVGDIPLMLTLAHKGKVGFLSDVMCVYRKNVAGSWSSRMASSIENRRRHHRAIVKMWRQFDTWSGKNYHDIVLKKIRNNQKFHLLDELTSLKNLIFK